MPIHAAVFDLDGTLLDTLEDLADAMNAVLAGLGFPPHPLDSYRYFVGTGLKNLAKSAVPPGTPEEVVSRVPGMMKEIYGKNWARKTRPYPGIPELLDALRTRGIPLGILSNKPDDFTQVMAAHFFPGLFQAVRGLTDDVPRKPDPAGALIIAQGLGVRPEDCLYLGDTNTDMETGRAAGMVTVGVSWGFRPVRELEEAGAMAVIDHPSEALSMLGGVQ